MTIERVRAVIDAATPGPWFWDSYSGIFSTPVTQERQAAEDALPDDAPDEAYEGLPEPFVCRVDHIDHGDLATEQGEHDARAIALAHDLMPELLASWEALADAVKWLGDLDIHTSCNLNVAPDWVPGLPECTCGADDRLDALRAALAALDAKAKEVLG